MSIKMIVDVCKCHDKPADTCHFIRTLRDLNAHQFAQALVEERIVPDCSTSG